MRNRESPDSPNAFTALRRFVRTPAPALGERCEVCGQPLPREHAHLFEPASRQVMCVCAACAVSVGDQAGTAYRRVPNRVCFLDDFQLSDAAWDGLMIPVGMAFFFRSTPEARVLAFYPSPAGATESLLALESWDALVQANPVLMEMEPDVEALVVNRVKGASEHYLAPIDRCYELVGLIRAGWRGLSGGQEVWIKIEQFFAGLKARAIRATPGAREADERPETPSVLAQPAQSQGPNGRAGDTTHA